MAFANSNVSDLIATTLEQRSEEIADNVTNNVALLIKLQEKGNVRPFDGGRIIYEPLSFTTNPNGGWYSGYDVLPTAPADVISASEWAIKQYAVGIAVSGLEMLQNSGRSQLIDLVASRIKVGKSTMKNDLETGLYGDGTAALGKTIVGLDAHVAAAPSTGTVGNINRANFTFWRNQTQTTTVTAANAQAVMTNLWVKTVRGNDAPKLIMAGQTVYSLFVQSLQAIQRVMDPKLAEAGFQNVMFMGAPVVLGGGIGGVAGATNMYYLNTDYLFFRPHKDMNMKPLKKREAFNQDAEVTYLAWAGAFTASGEQFHGRLIGA